MREKPALRCISNLTVVPISEDENDTPLFLVTAPDSNERFQLGEEDLFLLRTIDGKQTIDEIISQFTHQFNLDLSKKNLAAFMDQMLEYHLLEWETPEKKIIDEAIRRKDFSPHATKIEPQDEPGASIKSETGSHGGLVRKPYRFKLFNPYRLFVVLNRIFSPFSFLIWLLFPAILISTMILINHHFEYLKSFTSMEIRFGLLSIIPHLLLALFTVVLVSRLAQGTVCVHFGAQQKLFGIQFLLGIIPRFFIDKREIRFLDHTGQLWAYATTLLVRLGFFSVCIPLWYLFRGKGYILGDFALFLGSIGLAGFLFMANPLWKADGYNFMTVYFRIENLRERAFLALKLFVLRRSFPNEVSGKLKWTLICFALMSIIYTLCIILGILILLGISLERRLQGTGVAIFVILLFLFCHWFISQRKGREKKRTKSTVSGPSMPGVKGPKSAASSSTPDKPENGLFARVHWIRAVFLGVLGAMLFLPYPYEPGGPATIFPMRRFDLFTRTTGEVTDVKVKEGDLVKSGQVIAKQSGWDFEKEISLKKIEIKKKAAQLNLLRQGSKTEEIKLAREKYDQARAASQFSMRELDRLKPLYEKRIISMHEYDNIRAKAAEDAAEKKVAAANLALVRSGPRNYEIDILKAEIQHLDQEISILKKELKKTFIIAPAAGRIATKDLDQKIGKTLNEGIFFATLEDVNTVKAEILVPETDISDVALGSPTEVKILAYPQKAFYGKVTFISPVIEDIPDNPFVRVIRVVTEISNKENLLKSEMTGYAKIEGKEKIAIVAFTGMLVRFVLVEIWSWLP